MPIIAAVGDQCVGNNISGVIITGSPTSKVLTFPIARVSDMVLITGISPLPPGGELVGVPVAFCPITPCLWFYIEYGVIVSSPTTGIDISLPIACDGAMWVSPHFNGVIKAALGIPNLVN
jgi:hypothetical protein